MSKQEFPNKWDEVMSTDISEIDSLDFESMIANVETWHIPEKYCCIIRAHNKKTGQISEFAYQRMAPARKKVLDLSQDTTYLFTIADDTAIIEAEYPKD